MKKNRIIEDMKEVKEFLLSDKIQNKTNWAKKYTLSTILGKKVRNRYPNAKNISFPYVEFTITDGEVNWDTSVKLVLSLDEHKYYYYSPYDSDITYEQKVAITGPWDEKLEFK